MMRRILIVFVLLHCGNGLLPYALGQEEFGEVLRKKASIESQLKEIEEEYRRAQPTQKEQIRLRHRELDKRLSMMLGDLRASALKAYKSQPNQDMQIVNYLLNQSLYDYEHDNAFDAFETLDTLIENGCRVRGVYDLASLAAYRANEFEKAQQYMDQAREDGSISEETRRMKFSLTDRLKEWATESKLRQREAQQDDLPRVKLETNRGDIIIELFENEAPQTVANFVHLVEKKFYDGLTFHRVISNFMAQGGDPKADGTGGPGYEIYCECYNDNARNHFAGSVAMAHMGRDTGGSQFYITYIPTPHLNGQHTVFGRVVEGMNVLARLNKEDANRRFQDEVTPDKVVSATVIRKRDHEYVPTKVK